jgi:DNA-binding NarL/FixJ family response regulator
MDDFVVIAGVPDLPKKLLAYTIEKEMGIPCELMGERVGVPAKGKADQKTLVLVDFAEAEREALLADLRVNAILGSDRHVVALYNVGSAADVENVGVLRGIQGLFYQHDPIELLVKGIRALLAGEIWLPRKVLVQIALRAATQDGNGLENARLTRREIEILSCVGAGHTNDEIGRKLCVSSHTVKTHLYRVFKKIKVRNRFQASLWAARHL